MSSTVIAKNLQVGADGTASNNFTIYQPASPDGTLRIGNGNTGTTSAQVVLNSSGNVGIGTSSPTARLDVVTPNAGSVRIRGVANDGARLQLFNNEATTNGFFLGQGFATGTDNIAYVSNQANADMIFRTNATDRMRIDSAGNVGIGTAPSAWGGTYRAIENLLYNSSFSNNGGFAGMAFNAFHNGTNWIYKNTTNANLFESTLDSFRWYTAPSGTAGNAISFTEAMRIDSSGNLLVGTSSAFLGGRTNFQSSVNGQLAFRHTAQAAGRHWFMGVESGNDVFIIYPDIAGGVYMTRGATSWTGNSDERLKTDLQPIENAAEKVSQLRAVTGRFKTDDEGVSRAFLIAQDVQAVLPEAVDVRDDEQGTLGIRYTDTIPLLVAAIKELKAELDTVKAELQTLKGN